jgi:Phosphotransferase System HPr (HPr) Family
MREVRYVITDEMGLHARPAGLLVKTAQKYKSQILLKNGEKSCNAKKIYGLMELRLKKGSAITFTVEGEDEDTAAEDLKEFLKQHL